MHLWMCARRGRKDEAACRVKRNLFLPRGQCSGDKGVVRKKKQAVNYQTFTTYHLFHMKKKGRFRERTVQIERRKDIDI